MKFYMLALTPSITQGRHAASCYDNNRKHAIKILQLEIMYATIAKGNAGVYGR